MFNKSVEATASAISLRASNDNLPLIKYFFKYVLLLNLISMLITEFLFDILRKLFLSFSNKILKIELRL